MTPPPSTPPAVGPLLAVCTAVEYDGNEDVTHLTLTVPGIARIGFLFDQAVVVPLALDASGQRVVPDELVQNCLAELERRGAVMSPDRAECEKDIRDVLSAALLSAGSLGLEGRK